MENNLKKFLLWGLFFSFWYFWYFNRKMNRTHSRGIRTQIGLRCSNHVIFSPFQFYTDLSSVRMIINLYQFVFFDELNRAGRLQSEDGGEQIYLPVMYQTNPTPGWYQGNDTIDISKRQTHTMTNWPWRFLAGTYQISFTIAIEQTNTSGSTRAMTNYWMESDDGGSYSEIRGSFIAIYGRETCIDEHGGNNATFLFVQSNPNKHLRIRCVKPLSSGTNVDTMVNRSSVSIIKIA